MGIRVIKEKDKSSVTDKHLLVKNLTDFEVYGWDPTKIVQALRDECNISRGDAEKIEKLVYEDLIKRKKTEIDVSTLKNLVNYHLFMEGFNGKKLEGQISLGMSLYDLEHILFEKSDENSNVSNNNPEAVNLVVSENTWKKYALKRVFSKDVSTAHLEGLIHLHDLGQVHKFYAESKDTIVDIEINGETKRITLQELWDMYDVPAGKLNSTQYIKMFNKDHKIKFGDEMIHCTQIVYSDEDRDMVEFELSGDVKKKVTNDHGCIVRRDKKLLLVRADDVLKDDKIIKV